MKEVIIEIPSPFTALTWGILSYIFIFMLSPLTPKYLGSVYSWSYLFFSILSLYIGLIFGYRRLTFRSKQMHMHINTRVLRKVFKIIFIIAVLGVLLRIIDKYYLRGATFSLNIAENREALFTKSTGIISIISAMLYPFSFLILYYYLFLQRLQVISKWWMVLMLPIALFPMIDGIFFGSRSSALVFVSLTIFYAGVFKFFKIRLNIKTMIFSVVFFIIMFSFSGYMFSFRTENLGMDPILSTQISGYAHFVQLDKEWTNFLYSVKGSLLYYFYIGIVNFVQYVSHGVFELLYLVDYFNIDKATYGGQNFFIVIKFFSRIFDFNLNFIGDAQLRSGIYTTFMGPVYYDYAYLGILFSFFFSFLTGRMALHIVKKKNVTLLPLYLYLLVILFFVLVVSLLVSAQGFYVIVSFYISHLIARRYINKKSIHIIYTTKRENESFTTR